MTKLQKNLVVLGIVAVGWALGPDVASACEMCWGAGVDTPITRGISMAMLSLIGMVGVVGGGIGAFFYNVQRRSSRLERSDVVVTQYGDVRHVDGDPS
ncbi:MAG: hypothetical protein WD021_03170 [Rhodothermales bacterium]